MIKISRIKSMKCPEHGKQDKCFVHLFSDDGTSYCLCCRQVMTVEWMEEEETPRHSQM
jgi:uncharacterized Zn finger protein (UPF0148 family)